MTPTPLRLAMTTRSARETARVAELLARALAPPRRVLVRGDLGSGKTTFVKGFIAATGVDAREVKSPTYAIARTHAGAPPVHHLDLYRFDDEASLVALGIEELLDDQDALVVVEWPERMPSLVGDPEAVVVDLTLVSARQRDLVIALPPSLADAGREIARALSRPTTPGARGGRRRPSR